MTYNNSQIGSGASGLLSSDALNSLSDPGFTNYLSTNSIDVNALTPTALKGLQDSYSTLPKDTWSMEGLGNKVGGPIGTDSKGLERLGSFVGSGMNAGTALYGMYNQGQMADLAKDQYKYQKGVAEEQRNIAREDRATAQANRTAATNAYYGKPS